MSIFFLIHSFKSNFPGSDNSGVPASEIRDKILPILICSIILYICFFSLNLWYETNFFLIFK